MTPTLRTAVLAVGVRRLSIAVGFMALLFPAISGAQEPAEANKPVSYYRDIRPIFQARCHGCHQPAKASGDYVMTSIEQLRQGGESEEPAVVPHEPDESRLIALITPDENGQFEMPQGKNSQAVAASDIDLIRRWIDEGAEDDTPSNARERYTADNPPSYSRQPVISAMDFSPDGQLLALTGFHEILVHKADGSGLVARLIGMSERVESVAFSPDGKKLAATAGLPARMGELQIWDVATWKLELSVPVTYDTIYGASWSPDGQLVAVGCGDNSLRAFDVKTGEQVVYMAAHEDWVRDTVFSGDGKSVFTVSRDKTVKMTDVATQRFVGNITTHTPGILRGGMNSIDRHPQRNEVLVGGADGAPKLFQMDVKAAPASGGNPNQIREYAGMPGRVFGVCFQSDAARVFAGSSLDGSGQVRSYETDSGKELWKQDIAEAGIFAVACSPDGKILAAAGSDGLIRLLDTGSGSIQGTITPIELSENSAGDQGISLARNNIPDIEGTESIPQGFQVVRLTANTERVQTLRPTDYVQLLLTAELTDAAQADVTRMAQWTVEGDVGTVDQRGVFTPHRDGSGRIIARLGEQQLVIPAEVSGVDGKFEPDYVRDVNPVISKLGCNAGTCHGSKEGKNGFKLSLRGYDALFDVRAFTDDLASRRANVAVPDKSLMLLKATGAVPHVGGQVTPHGSKYYRTIRDWIGGGARLKLDSPKVAQIVIQPENPVIQRIGGRQQMRIVATYADGSTRDVTLESHITSGNTEIATHDEFGLLTSVRRGESPVLARFEGRYAATTLTVMGDRTGFVWSEPPANNEIDRLVARKWERMKILPSELCSDEEFLRRVYLDLIGLPPTVQQIQEFRDDPRPNQDKREALIDRLVGSEEYIEHWTNKWADLLQVNRKFLGLEGATSFRQWIRNEVAQNTPYDQLVGKILTATGSNKDHPAASYFKILRTPEDTMENTTQLFLATRFNCNKCHDHPFERWTQDQYYELAAFFARFQLKRDPESGKREIGGTAVEGNKPLYEIVEDVNQGEVVHDRTGQQTAPSFPYPVEFESPDDATRRQQLSSWVTSPDNPYFARSYVNRLWGYLFGVGIIDPIDDIRAGNPPTNPELLDWLTEQFVASGFDVQQQMKLICKSRVYQLSVRSNQWNHDDQVNFSHFVPRRLTAEVLLDSIYHVAGTQSKFPGLAPGTRAAELPDSEVNLPDGFLNNLGRPPRESSCECERSNSLQLGPVMALMSGPTVNDAISDSQNAIAQLARSEMEDRALVERLFLRIINRLPSDEEIQTALQVIQEGVDADHQRLAESLAECEQEFSAELAQLEQARQQRIELAQGELSAYEQQIAPREAELDRQQQQRIAEAQQALDAFDADLPQRLAEWEQRARSGNLGWVTLDPRNLSASNGAKLERLEDLSVIASGDNGKTSYQIQADSELEAITGLRLELLADDRLPGKGPGRAPNGNLVLTELEVTAAPRPELQYWDVVQKWDADTVASAWKPTDGAQTGGDDEGVQLTGAASTSNVTLDPWYWVGPFFDDQGFDKPLGPEGQAIDLQQQFAAGDKQLAWQQRSDLKDGQVLNFEPGSNCVNYFYRRITSREDRQLELKLGSDDGIKVWVNGQQVLANNTGRGAAPDQEIVKVGVKQGHNDLLIKIHNMGGPSGIYFLSDASAPQHPALVSELSAPAGSFVLQLTARSDNKEARVYWATQSENSYSDQRVAASSGTQVDDTPWLIYRFAFTSADQLAGLRLEPSGGSMIVKDITLYRNELPTKVALQNATADFSQNGFEVAKAIDGQAEDGGNGWALHPKVGSNRVAAFETKDDLRYKGGSVLTVTLHQQFNDGQHTIGRFRLSVTTEPRPVLYGVPDEIERILAVAPEQRNDEQRQQLVKFYQANQAERLALANKLAEEKKPRPIDPQLAKLRQVLDEARQPVPIDPRLARLRRDFQVSQEQIGHKRVTAAQDIAWALINSPSFLFNH